MDLRIFILLVAVLVVEVNGCGSGDRSRDGGVIDVDDGFEQGAQLFLDELNFLDSVVAGQFNDKPGGYPLDRIQRCMEAVEQLTELLSDADGTDIGRIAPSSGDLRRWRKWFEANRGCLRLRLDLASVHVDTSCQNR